MDVVVIDNEDSTVLKACLKIKGICLHGSDRRMLSDGQWLYGTHLSAMQFFLKEQFPQVKGLEDTALVCKILPGNVQVLHVNGNHWLQFHTGLQC